MTNTIMQQIDPTGELQNKDQTKPNADDYKTAESLGADYSAWGNFKNWFTGANKVAEDMASAYNTAISESKARDYASKEAEITRNFNAAEAATARNFAAQEAEKTRQWEQMMQDTKYQRMTKDAEKAGINPLYLIGATGSTPPGATAQPTAASATATNAGASYGGPKFEKENNGSKGRTLQALAMTALTIAKILA